MSALRAYLSFIIITTLLIASACAAPKNKTPAAILVFGDSLTAGNMLPSAERDRLWTRQIQQRSNGAITLLNEGKGGRPTASVDDFKAALARHPNATALVIMLGTNDSRDTTAQCVPKAVANLSNMIEHTRQTHGPNFPILLIAPPNINNDALGPSKPIADKRDANLRAFTAAYRALAEKQNTRFATLYGLLPPETLAEDGVHPDATGNDILAATLLPELQNLAQ